MRRGEARRGMTAWQAELTKAQWAQRASDLEDRVKELEAAAIRIAALAYSYNAETPDKRFVELGEAARAALGEARY